MRFTALPEVTAALVAGFAAALDGVDVGDEISPSGTYTSGDALIIGFGDDTNPVARSTREALPGSGTGVTETLAINCALFSASTDGTAAARRAALADFLAVVDEVVRSDRTLGGLVDDLFLAPSIEFFIGDGPSGDAAYAQFALIAETYL